jgi:hypothetical protein
MANQKKSNLVLKIVLIPLLFVVLLALGGFMVFIALNMDQLLYIRVLIGASGVVWAIVSIWFVWFRTDYSRLWRRLRYRRQYKNMHKLRTVDPDYYELYQKYPLSIRRHERHCVHHDISPDEMISSALEIPEQEWAAREAFRNENLTEQESSSSPDTAHSGHQFKL